MIHTPDVHLINISRSQQEFENHKPKGYEVASAIHWKDSRLSVDAPQLISAQQSKDNKIIKKVIQFAVKNKNLQSFPNEHIVYCCYQRPLVRQLLPLCYNKSRSKHSCENMFSISCKSNSFPSERFCLRTCFETEAKAT